MKDILKIDLHLHTGEDPKDRYIPYSARELLRKASEYKFDAIAIANHTEVLYTDALRDYAEQLGIVLIPGVEACVEGKHVVLVNCRQHQQYRRALTFQTLRAYAGQETLIIAPHPFYPKSYCLHEKLEQHIEVFDAIEYSHLHFRLVNFNKKAVALTEKYHLPLVGTSDAHHMSQFGTTYSLVKAEKTIPAILEAIKRKQVQVVTAPLSQWILFRRGQQFLFDLVKKKLFPDSQSDECG